MIERTLGRGFGVALAAALGVAALAALAPGSPTVSSCAGAGVAVGSGPDHVALLVEHGDGTVVTRCVAFGAGQITGEQLLDASEVAWSGQTFGGFGVAVCAVDSEPAHYSSCPGKDNYWAIFVSRGGGSWQFSSAGISSLTLTNGDAEGFRYVPAVGNAAAPPAPAGVCVPAPTTLATTTAVAATPSLRGAATATAAVTPTTAQAGATAQATASEAATAGVMGPATSGATAAATVSAAATAEATSAATAPPAPPGGIDPGLLLAALAGGGLGGLALLRLLAGRNNAGTPRT